MPNIDPDKVHEIGQAIEDEVVPLLEEANTFHDTLCELDLSLYTTVLWPLAASYSIATSFALEAAQGAAEDFRSMHSLLDTCADSWAGADDAVACNFGEGE